MNIIKNKKFEKKVEKLPQAIKKALARRICLFMVDPFALVLNNHALHGSKRSYRSLNITGDYRLIYEDHDVGIARLVDIDTHSNLY